MNKEIKLYKLSKLEQNIISNYQNAKLEMINKFNANWYKNQICKMFENVKVEKGEIGEDYKYLLSATIKDYIISFKMNKDEVVIHYIEYKTKRKGIQILDYKNVNYNMQKLQEIKEQVLE